MTKRIWRLGSVYNYQELPLEFKLCIWGEVDRAQNIHNLPRGLWEAYHHWYPKSFPGRKIQVLVPHRSFFVKLPSGAWSLYSITEANGG